MNVGALGLCYCYGESKPCTPPARSREDVLNLDEDLGKTGRIAGGASNVSRVPSRGIGEILVAVRS